MTIAIDLGTTTAGSPATLDLEELLATRLLVQGNSGSGKSHLLRRLMEQSAAWVQQAVIDPEGDFVSLAEKFGHLVIDAAAQTERGLQAAAERMREHRVSVVLNLEGLDAEGQMRQAAVFLNGMFEVDRDLWSPVLVVVDEAQIFAPAAATEVSDEARRASLGAMANLMSRGRKRGLAGIIATQRLAKLAKNVAAEASNFLMGRTFLDIDMQRAADLLGMERRQAEQFRDLPRGSFVALGPALSRRPLPIRIGVVETQTRSAGPKLTPLPNAPEEVRELILTPPPEPVRPARRAPPPPAPDILAQLAAARPPAVHSRAEPAPPSPEELAERERRLEEVLHALLEDPEAAFRPVSVLYGDFLVRCRIRAVAGKPMELPEFRARLAVARAGVDAGTAENPEWDAVRSRAAALPEDVQGVYLMLARAALERRPCPSDAAIAQAYGTRSLGRARRVLAYLEEQGMVVQQQDRQGRRVALVELGWETAPGDANAEAA
ncbi:putative ATP-binding protein [Roseomonas mucosa]|uniref:Type IV secretory pathway, VirB4 components n=3 Tax=Roseomonas mucosa TaxID=207340 RepID=A0A379MVX6_9PROT|nr:MULTISPECIES: ATP-binding protein [Roseomonas]MBS5902901.1 ATP-binding protein [Acetobacteraceae bacterium]AWV24410.1 putative ATP-binding protein [Roseomonas mucosa]MDT8274861.1 ATP-binding protein [Roseomonas mucosa]MDT8289945.1 ATP-binding protein [Roseomonas mucosa]MDT8294266.1 ATP-binding protein [Roseomonas mucosa]